MGYVEHQEAQIRELYDIFRKVCIEARHDSYAMRKMTLQEQELYIKLYRTLKKMLNYMEAKNVKMVDSDEIDSKTGKCKAKS